MSASPSSHLLQHLLATDGEALGDLSTWLDEAEAELGAFGWDPHGAVVSLPFAQEPFGAGGLGPRHLRRTWLYDEFELPLLACRLLVHDVGRPRFSHPLEERTVGLLGIAWYPAIGALRIDLSDGGWIELPATRVFAEIEVTDRVVTWARRRIGRWLPYTTTFHPPQ